MSAPHTYHPDVLTSGLADGCPRCSDLAGDPLGSMDDACTLALVQRTQAWMRDEPGSGPRTSTELRAMRKLEGLLVAHRQLGRLGVPA